VAFIDRLPPFVPGLELCERFFVIAVAPLLAWRFPALVLSAGCLERGSDVMGFDTPQSRDHHWGPKVTIFLRDEDLPAHAADIDALMAAELPATVDGYPTHFNNPEVDGGQLAYRGERPLRHGVSLTSVAAFTRDYLGVDATRPIDELAWLTIPSQRLFTVRAGRVFRDDIGLAVARERLHFYPHDIWLYRMANQWRRIEQKEAFVGRCGDVGDELGSRLVASRQIFELMRLCFLIERQYAPYAKWFGSAFARLACAPRLTPVFHQTLAAEGWREREQALGEAYLQVGELHNGLGVTSPVDVRLASFFERPYLVPHSLRFSDVLHDRITSARVRALPRHVGAADQFVDSTDVEDSVSRLHSLLSIFDT
jgi:hypothetical protein